MIRPRTPAAARLLATLAALALTTGATPASAPRVAVEPAAVALARLDSLQSIVKAEEVRVRTSLGLEANWDRLARAWFQVGDHAKAAHCLDRARAIGGREFDTALLSGRVARSEGRFAEAIDFLDRAVHMRPDDWEAREDLGLALYLSGRMTQAAEHWDLARSLPGSAAPDRSGLLDAMRAVGDSAYSVSGRAHEWLRFVRDRTPGAMIVPARIGGRGPFLLRIDPGSPECVLGRSLARELGLRTFAGAPSGAGAGGVAFDYATLDSLSLGDATLHRLVVAVTDHRSLAGPQGVRGTLGLEALRRFRFCLDLPDSVLWLDAAADTTPPAWVKPGSIVHRVPVLLRGTHLLVVYGRVNGAPERPFLLDTGAPGIGLAAPASTIAEAGIALDTTQAHTGSSASGPVGYFEFRIGHLCVGDACRDSLTGVYGTFAPRLELNPNFRLAGIVSNGFLARYRVGIDLAHRQVWLVVP